MERDPLKTSQVENLEKENKLKKDFVEIVAASISKYPQTGLSLFQSFEILKRFLLKITNIDDINFVLSTENYNLEDYKYFQSKTLEIYKAHRGLNMPDIIKNELTDTNHNNPLINILKYFCMKTQRIFSEIPKLENTTPEEISEIIKDTFNINGLAKRIKTHKTFLIKISQNKNDNENNKNIISEKSKEISKFFFDELNKKIKKMKEENNKEDTDLKEKIYEYILKKFKERYSFV